MLKRFSQQTYVMQKQVERIETSREAGSRSIFCMERSLKSKKSSGKTGVYI